MDDETITPEERRERVLEALLRSRRYTLRQDLRAIMATPEGRRVMWWVTHLVVELPGPGLLPGEQPPNPHNFAIKDGIAAGQHMAYGLGRASMCTDVAAELQVATPSPVLVMNHEHLDATQNEMSALADVDLE